MANIFEKELGIPLPKCCSTGDCCKGASPSTPYHKLLQRATEGDEFARGFFSIMVPYSSHSEAEKVVPGLVQRTLKASEKLEEFKSPDDIVFYSCRYLTSENKCGVWEDRPQFCRDYPDTPFVVMAPGCAFEPWGKACKEKYNAMKAEVAHLKELKEELNRLKGFQAGVSPGLYSVEDNSVKKPAGLDSQNSLQVGTDPRIDELLFSAHNTDNLSLVLSLTRLYVASPLRSLYLR